MITVTILINGNPILTRSARNLGQSEDNPDLCFYKVDDATIVAHKPSDGAVALAHKLLDTIKEP